LSAPAKPTNAFTAPKTPTHLALEETNHHFLDLDQPTLTLTARLLLQPSDNFFFWRRSNYLPYLTITAEQGPFSSATMNVGCPPLIEVKRDA
jgi:hypothetical protein